MTRAITPEALRAAWEAMRYSAPCRRWPQDFDQVMADPARLRLVRIAATVRARPARPPTAPAPRPAAPTPLPRVLPAAVGLFDRKRAAAGDRDD